MDGWIDTFMKWFNFFLNLFVYVGFLRLRSVRVQECENVSIRV